MMLFYFCASAPEKSEKQSGLEKYRRMQQQHFCTSSGPGGWLQFEPCGLGVALSLALPSL